MNFKWLIGLVFLVGCGVDGRNGFDGPTGETGPTGAACSCPTDDESGEQGETPVEDKVWVCHNGRSLHVSVESAVKHLNKHEQDYEGVCR